MQQSQKKTSVKLEAIQITFNIAICNKTDISSNQYFVVEIKTVKTGDNN